MSVLDGIEKLAGLPPLGRLRSLIPAGRALKPSSGQQGSLDGLKNFGKGTFNFAFGGKTHPNGKWDPLFGVKTLGTPRQKVTDGPLKGMFKYDPHTGEAAMAGKHNVPEYLRQELHGMSPTRADRAVHHFAKKKKLEGLARIQDNRKNGRPWNAEAPAMNPGQYMATASAKEKKVLAEMQQMGTGEFIKKYPGIAADLYGRKALYGGLTVGLPAMELYDAAVNKEGPHPDSGMGGNVGSSLATTIGMTATMPLGIAGSMLTAPLFSRAGKAVGDRWDQARGNRPFREAMPKNGLLPNPNQPIISSN